MHRLKTHRWAFAALCFLFACRSRGPEGLSLGGAAASNAESAAITFRAGANGYNGANDVSIMSLYPGNGYTDRSNLLAIYRISGTSGYEAHTLIKFTGLSLPVGAQVTAAKLTLTFDTWDTGFAVAGYHLKAAWNNDSPSLGWINRNANLAWTLPGATSPGNDYLAGKSFSIDSFKGSGNETRTITLDTAVVQSWLNDSAANQGIVLVNQSPDKVLRMFSARDATVSRRPLLDITYSMPTTSPPTIGWISPATGATLSGTATLNTSAKNATSVQFLLDGAAVGSPVTQTPCALTLDTKTIANGAHTFAARATNNSGSATTPAISVAVNNTTSLPSQADTTLPIVTMTAPSAGQTVTGTITATAAASDNVAVSGVQFLLDGANVGSEDTSAPYSVAINTTTLANGAHTIGARARDAAGNTATATVQAAVSNTVPPPSLSSVHPRVYLNAANRARLNNALAAQTPAAVRFKSLVDSQLAGANNYSFQGYFAALLGQLTGQASYCTYAVNFIDNFVASEEALINSNQRATVAGDSYLQVGPVIGDVMLVYDWCFNTLTANQRTRWTTYANQAVWNVWNPNAAQWGNTVYAWSGWSIDDPGDNYYYSFLRATMLFGLAAKDEHPAAAGDIDFFRTTKIQNELVPMFEAKLQGGGSREGTGYGTAMKELFTLYDLWEGSTGERIADLTSHTRSSIYHLIHETVPTLDRIAPIGDQSRDATAMLFDYHRHYMLAAVRPYATTPIASIALHLANDQLCAPDDTGLHPNLRLHVCRPVDGDRAALSSQHRLFRPGIGQIYLRSGWERTATWMNVMAGAYDQSHAHHDQGSFLVYKNEWLAYDHNVDTASGIEQDEAQHNLVQITGVNQREGAPPTNLIGLRSNAAYDYVSLDAAPIYESSSVQAAAVRSYSSSQV